MCMKYYDMNARELYESNVIVSPTDSSFHIYNINMIWMQQKLYEINIYWNICVFHDMTLSACNRNIMTKIIQTFTKYCAVAVLQCQWNFGDDVETQFKFNSKSVTLVISTREYYELFQFKMLEINKTSFKYIESR